MSDIKKQVEQIVSEILKQDTVQKAMPASEPANGGEDKMHSGSPLNETLSEDGDKKDEAKKADSEEKDEEKKDAKKDDKKEEKKDEKKMEKSEESEEEKEEKDEEKDEAKKAKKMKKSLADLSAHLDSEELEVIKAWREEEVTTEVITKSETSSEDLKKSLIEAVSGQFETLKKAIEDKDALVKSLSEKIEKMASQPAYDRRSITNLEAIEKSSASENTEISKAQVLDAMLDLQKSGKGVTSHHVAEFEATRNISNPQVRELVFKHLNIK